MAEAPGTSTGSSDTSATTAAARPSAASMRKVALTSLAGTSIEWFDFFLYGTAAALVFPKLFFSEDMPYFVSLIASFSTFAVGFLARPIGGIVFGHFGDRLGRKKALVTALLLMGGATTLIGLLPTYASIGVAAPLLLMLLRFAQGLAVGGQWGGAMLLVTENAPADQRGFYGAFAQAGAPAGLILANAAFLTVTAAVSPDDFMAWGWRIPFVSSVILIGLSLYVQLRLEDTPAFKELQARQAATPAPELSDEDAAAIAVAQQSPVLQALVTYPRQIALAAGAFLAVQVTFYILISFVIAYGTNPEGLNLPRSTMLLAVLVSSAFQLPALFLADLPLAVRRSALRRHDVWASGCLSGGAVQHPRALLGRLTRLSVRRHPRRRHGAHHRHRIARLL